MKPIILACIMFFSFNCLSQTIKGKVIDKDSKKPLANSFVYLVTPDNTQDTIDIYYFGRYKYKILKQTQTDFAGNYSFIKLTPKKYNIVADFPMPESKFGGYGTVQQIDSNVYVGAKMNYSKTFYLMVTCPYDKTKNQSFCPVCKKADKVKPILFGLPAYDENGNFPEGYHLGGCFVDPYCNPTKHCSRCKKDF